jgi:hypothetical protein
MHESYIGAMAQSGKSSQNGGNASYYQLTVGYRFSSKDAGAEANKEEQRSRQRSAAGKGS